MKRLIKTIIIFTIFNTFFVMADGGDFHPTRDWNKSISNNKDNHLSHLISTSPNIEFERDNQFPDFETLNQNGRLSRDGDLYLYFSIYQEWSNNNWINNSQYTYTYDYVGNQLSELREHWDGYNWISDEQYILTYDNDGNLLIRLHQYWSGNDWVNNYLINYTYNNDSNLLIRLYQEWSGNDWVNNYLINYTYDNVSNLIIKIYQNWEGNNWVNENRYTYTYDSDGNQLSMLFQEWIENNWVSYSQYTVTYDTDGNQLSSLTQIWDGNNWVNNSLLTYTYDTESNLLSSLYQNWDGSIWVNYIQNTYTYNTNGNRLSKLRQDWDGSNWVNDFQYIYTYDTDGNRLSELYQYWESNDWLSSYQNTYTYDNDGNQLSLLGQDWDGSGWVNIWYMTQIYQPILLNVVINEIMNNPSSVSDSDGEWFELYNPSNDTIDLSSLIIHDSDGDTLIIPENTGIVSPFSFFVLGVNGDTLTNGGIHIDLVYNRDDFNLGNGDDEIIIYDEYNREIDRVEYDDGVTFPDPNGKSMELNYLEYDNNDGVNWSESTHLLPSGDYGTPGESNSVLFSELFIESVEGYFLGTPLVSNSIYSFLLEIQNNGTGELFLSSIETNETQTDNPDNYIYTEYGQDSMIVIPPFQQGYIEVYFQPSYSSIFYDTLNFTTNDSNFLYVEIPLEAWGTTEENEIHIDFPFSELVFDSIETGGNQEITIQIYNLGYSTLEIDEITTTSPFSVNQSDGSIDNLGVMDLVISFNPDSIGEYTSDLVIESNDSDEGTLTLSLVGYSYTLGTDDENNQLPSSYVLHQNYPNPFNPITTIKYDLPKDSQVKIMIYDIMGREVRTLINNQQTSGFQSVVWNGTNDFGQEVSVGMYLYRISAGEFHQVKKMVLLK